MNWNLLREDLSLPSAVLYEDRLRHNLDWMQRLVDAYGAKLAPHGKTTMAPTLFHMQLKRGAWGITLATAQQTKVAYWHGVRRVLMANQLIGKENMAIISRLMEDPTFEYYCLVDSVEQIDLLGEFYSRRNQRLKCCWSWEFAEVAPAYTKMNNWQECSPLCSGGAAYSFYAALKYTRVFSMTRHSFEPFSNAR